jgi:type VI secretion system protein ImpM
MTTMQKPIKLGNPTPVYFGKIASRGDFVRSASGGKLITLLDNWAAQGMDMLIAAPDWKTRYDNCGLIDFLFIGTQKRHAVSGSILPSCDASSRRFPFLAATWFEVDEALRFLPLSSLALERNTNHQRALMQIAAKTHDAADTLTLLGETSLGTELDSRKYVASHEQFLDTHSLDDLSTMLQVNGARSTVRQMLLALGYLLKPILANHAAPPQKGLTLPLPHDPAKSSFVKTLWLDLISLFLARADFELSIFSCHQNGDPCLVVMFHGATPATFCSLFPEDATKRNVIDISQSDWVEDCVRQEAAVSKLSSYLEHGKLTLRQIVDTFRQSFTA